MCSVNDDSELIPSEPQQVNPSQCKKCGEAAVMITPVKHAYCSNCFLAMATHKFRAVLGKSKLMNIKDRVVAVYLGTPSSVAMLHLLRAGLSENSHKRFLFSAMVLYIDEGGAHGKNVEDRKVDLKEAAAFISKLNFDAYYTKLEDVLNVIKENICVSLDSNSDLSVSDEAVQGLQQILETASSLSAKEDLLHCLRQRLILTAAKELNATKAFVDLCGTDLAVQIMSDVALGRGLQLQYNVGFCDARDPHVKILRPMRDLSRKEVAYYNKFHDLEESGVTAIGTKAGSHASIQNLSEHFVLDLQENFPSTVSTIFRTGEKLGGTDDKAAESGEDNCALCEGRLDTSTEVCSSLEATKFSRLVSSLGPKGFDNVSMKPVLTGETVSEKSNDSCACKSDASTAQGCCRSSSPISIPTEEAIFPSLCYGCQLMYRDMKSPSLPPFVLQAIHERSNLRKMRDTLQDFLL